MTEQVSAKPQTRLFHLDNLRVFLTLLVIFHHAAIAYGGAGDWPIKDPAVDDVSPIFLVFFNAVNQAYFMSAFFLLAGYFTPRSLERKGAKQFLIDRLIRLGIPILVYTTVLQLILDFMILRFVRHSTMSTWTIIKSNALSYEPGHLWFLQALLLFAFIYVLFRVLVDRRRSNESLQFYRDTFPPDAILFLWIGILTALTFAVRLVFPVGMWFLRVQPGHFVHYTFCFYVGVLAYRGDWFNRLSKAQARRWGIMSLVAILLFFPIGIFGGALEGEANMAKFAGGLHWQAFAVAAWESFLMIGIIVFLLYFFRERLNRAGPMAKSMAVNVYTVYIIHQLILIALNILMLSINIPTILKFFIVSLVAVPVCFLLSSLIRRIPYARRVLG
jgi:surface polysaccharide O-acyltransferase-like enzyme